MGDLNVRLISTQKQLNDFTKHLLADVHALQRMLDEDYFEKTPIHIGAEQEICIVDRHYKPSPTSLELLNRIDNPMFTTELALFNIEANLIPKRFESNCFSALEAEIHEVMTCLKMAVQDQETDFVLTGILPTIRKFDVDIDHMTPLERYSSLLKAINKMRGNNYELKIVGIDELNIKQESAMLESCNTSFQVHLQVAPEEFVKKYNLAQAICGPVLAVACNSPILFGKRLWSETRVALFQQSVDTRVSGKHIRDRLPRVTFGNKWLEGSIVELYKEDISRFRVMLTSDFEDDVMGMLDQGLTPKLRSLMIHNSTVYRWNRPCYGISPNGKPHLRIENRVLPSGPSVVDEVANAAFWVGLMNGLDNNYPDITKKMDFEDAKHNFLSAARNGLNTDFTWVNGEKINASELITKELLPLAEEGLKVNGVDREDCTKYLEIIEERCKSRQTGSQWMLDSYAKMIKTSSREEATLALTSSMAKNQKSLLPIHKWKLASIGDISTWNPASVLVEEFMTTDLFTVQQDDIPEFVADMLNWRRIKTVPVEDAKGRLKGLINFRILLQYYSEKMSTSSSKSMTVKDLMIHNPTTIGPDATIAEALDLMLQERADCLPVVKADKLVGLISEGNFLNITASLIRKYSEK